MSIPPIPSNTRCITAAERLGQRRKAALRGSFFIRIKGNKRRSGASPAGSATPRSPRPCPGAGRTAAKRAARAVRHAAAAGPPSRPRCGAEAPVTPRRSDAWPARKAATVPHADGVEHGAPPAKAGSAKGRTHRLDPCAAPFVTRARRPQMQASGPVRSVGPGKSAKRINLSEKMRESGRGTALAPCHALRTVFCMARGSHRPTLIGGCLLSASGMGKARPATGS